MRRTSLFLLAAGAGLLVVLVVLLQAVQSASSAATPSRVGEHREVRSASSHQEPPSMGARPAPGRRAFVPPPPGSTAPRASEDGAPSVPSDPSPPPATRANTKNLHFGGTQLRAQTAAVEPLVKKCVEADVAAGHSPTGKATLTYIVAQRDDRVAVEETGVDEEKTTLQGPELLECLHNTSRSMKFEGLPREAEALIVTRSVTLERGKLTENRHVGFSYLR